MRILLTRASGLKHFIVVLFVLPLVTLLTACGGSDVDAGGGDSNLHASRSFDANGDGLADILIETSSDAMPWRFGLSAGTDFDSSTSLQQTLNPVGDASARAIAVGDANGDGLDDVLVQLQSLTNMAHWQVLLSDGSGSVQSYGASLSLSAGDDARALAFTDVDGDGRADLLVQNQVNGVLNYYFARGAVDSFSSPELIYTFDTSLGRIELIAFEDIDGDGRSDLVFEQTSDGNHCYFVRRFIDGVFETQPSAYSCWATEQDFDLIEPSPDGVGEGGTQTIKRTKAVGVADVTGDGRAELVFSVTTSTLTTRRISSTPGAIQFLTNGQAPTTWYYLEFIDGPNGTQWQDTPKQLGTDSALLSVSTSGTAVAPETVELSDLNNDGRADILYELSVYDRVANSRTITVKAQLSRSNGTYEAQTWLEPMQHKFGAELGTGDFNGDGRLDLAITANGINSALQETAYAIVYLNDGSQFVHDPLGFAPYMRFDMPGKVRFLFRDRDGLTTLAQSTGALVAWSGVFDTKLYTPNEFKNFLSNKGYVLKPGNDVTSIKAGECQTVYASADADDLSVEFGTLTCLDLDGVTVRQQIIYGGCDLANQGGIGGVGGQCEIGTVRTEVGVNVVGVDQTLTAEGPKAGGCGAVSLEFTCARAGAQFASVSGKTMIGDTGVGAGVSIGLGGRAVFGADDGVLSGAIDLEVGIGVTIEFSIDYEAGGDFVVRHGATGYAFLRDDVGDQVVSAGEEVIDSVNVINDTGGIVVDGVGEGVNFVGGTATTIGNTVNDYVNDGVDAIASFFGF